MHDDLGIINGANNQVNFTKVGPSNDVREVKSNNELGPPRPGNLNAKIAINPVTDKIYVDGPYENITVIDGSTYRKISSVAIGDSLSGITVNPENNMIYVTNRDGSRLYVVNAISMHVIGTIINNSSSIYESHSSSIAFDPTINRYYVTRGDFNTLAVIDGKTGSLVKTLSVGRNPVYVAVNPTDHLVYVVNKGSNSVSVINDKTDNYLTGGTEGNQHTLPNSKSIGFPVENNPTKIAINSDAKKLYVAYGTSDKISVIDESTGRLINTLRLGYLPLDIAITPSTGRVYVTEKDSKTVSVIDGDTDKLVNKVNIGHSPKDLLVDPINNQIFVSHDDPYATVTSVIDGYTGDMIKNITTKEPTTHLAFDQNTGRLYMALGSTGLYGVSLFIYNLQDNATKEIPNFTGNRDISTMVINPVTGILYATLDNNSNEIGPNKAIVLNEYRASSVLNSSGVILSNITVGVSPSSMAVNSLTYKVYIANSGSNNVSIIDGKTNKGITNVTVGDSPSSIAIDPKTNIVYVANKNSDTISMINGSSNKIMTGIRLKVHPLDFGTISCNGRKISDDYILYDLGSNVICKASINDTSGHIPFIGYLLDYISKGSIEFTSWSEASDDTDSNPTTFAALQYETLIANFKQNPPPLPEWLLTAMIPIIISAVIALYKIFGKRTHRINTKEYEKKIESTYNALYQNREECLHRLDERRRQITELFAKGKISKKNYELLDNTISNYENEIFKL
jgi:YVTN family beta-propeller protein